MYRFIPPLFVLTPHDSNVAVKLRASLLLTVLPVVYAIVRLSSGRTNGFDPPCGSHQLPVFLLCTSEVAGATRTSVRMADFHRCGSIAVN